MCKNIFKLTIISLVLTSLHIMLINHEDMSYSNNNGFVLKRNLIVKEDYIQNFINEILLI